MTKEATPDPCGIAGQRSGRCGPGPGVHGKVTAFADAVASAN
jgi:hypothetical protein